MAHMDEDEMSRMEAKGDKNSMAGDGQVGEGMDREGVAAFGPTDGLVGAEWCDARRQAGCGRYDEV